MSDRISETRRLAESHGLDFRDCGEGHIQIRGNGLVVNYWPMARKQTVYCPELGRRETGCTPWNAVKMCMAGGKRDLRPKAHKKPPKRGPSPKDTKTKHSNPAGLCHFYGGDVPPWDDSLGEFRYIGTDVMRAHALDLERQAQLERAQADWVDGR